MLQLDLGAKVGEFEQLQYYALYNIDTHCIANLLSHGFRGNLNLNILRVHALQSKHFGQSETATFVCQPMAIVAAPRYARREIVNMSGLGCGCVAVYDEW